MVDVDFPPWFQTDGGTGAVIQSKEEIFSLRFKCINDRLLEIAFRGPDIRDSLNKRIPYCLDFKIIRINEEDIIKNKLTVWHEDPYFFKKHVKDGEIVELYVEWSHFKQDLFE